MSENDWTSEHYAREAAYLQAQDAARSELTELRVENAQLRAALRALVWADASGLYDEKPVTHCVYCETYEILIDGDEPFDHAPDCPITTARELLGGGGA